VTGRRLNDLRGRILFLRGRRVMLDADLAAVYGVTTKRLNEQVKRNGKKFPERYIFQLTKAESECLRSQIATSKKGRGGRRNRSPLSNYWLESLS